MERTLCLLKPDAVKRQLAGEVLTRIERTGLRIVASKILKAEREQIEKHYESVRERRGEAVFQRLLKSLEGESIWAFIVEGDEATYILRKLCGATEPLEALPGTIRGDFAHHSFGWADRNEVSVPNVIHASASLGEAKEEIKIWFTSEEIDKL